MLLCCSILHCTVLCCTVLYRILYPSFLPLLSIHPPFYPPSFSPPTHCRSYLCRSLVTVTRMRDKSSSLLESLAVSLASAFSPYEVVSAGARKQCSKALLQVSSLARQGYLLGEFNTSQKVADLVSEFTVLNEITVSNVTTQAIYPINTAVSKQLTDACLYKY